MDGLSIYEELGLKTIVNASDTYTKIGGSRMSRQVVDAMAEAARYFVDLPQLASKTSAAIAEMTHNEAAFVSSGCAACLVLASAALMTSGDPALAGRLPDTSACSKNEFVVFRPQTEIPALPYWRLIGLSGATVVTAEPSLAGLRAAISERCAGVWLFAGGLYEQGLPDFGDVIATAHEMGVRVLVDAAAQLPPVSNFWHYTTGLGADGVVFSGGKYIMGPQSSGLFLGNAQIAAACYAFSNPNVGIGRPYKVGKEEYVALYTAVKELLARDEEQVKAAQHAHLDVVAHMLSGYDGLSMTRVDEGRLGQDAPRLLIHLPQGKSGADCAAYLSDACNPAVDIGYFDAADTSGGPDMVFVNSINLQEEDAAYVAACLRQFLDA